MSIEYLNNLENEKRLEELLKCCGSSKWAYTLNSKFPFNNLEELINESEKIWFSLEKKIFLKLFYIILK